MKVIDFKDASCRHCYKCVRNCAVKAISVQNQQARIIEEACIHCGHCLEVCPQNAKTFASDLERILSYLKRGEQTVVSVAPSFLGDLSAPEKVAGALKRLGFSAVRETAEGAAYVTEAYGKLLRQGTMGNIISTCCPGVNDLIEKYYPVLVSEMAPVVSPVIAHGRLIKKLYGEAAKVVFLGPCIAKKQEAEGDERVAGAVDAILTFEELEQWLKREGISLEDCEEQPMDNPDPMVNRLYPIGGGILSSVQALCRESRYQHLAVSGVASCMELLEEMKKGNLKDCFLELNLCEGGCVKGPVSGRARETYALPVSRIQRKVEHRESYQGKWEEIPMAKQFADRSIFQTEPSEAEIEELLHGIGKYSPEDELNCGACGYSTCREKARAVYAGKAELDMCLPYAITRAESMANVMIDQTPDLLFLIDEDLEILECSHAVERALDLSRAEITGRYLFEFVETEDVEKAIASKENIINRQTRLDSLQMHVMETVVHIRNPQSLLVMYRDITREKQEQEKNLKMKMDAVEMAQKVIDRQMTVAQEIAGLLGETTAQTKVTLTKLRDTILEESAED
ncbi:MAG TPA: PAS domain-containing protein [Candidatus Blautia gallistercoris]|uniref:PAS domain-containing protein n=1 Tax=Candidatus Blautia gallistercoris TaxID=2838490 RepID=A0A9D1WIJ1_9FIRM|nr:PAS domain-containing protein [Candidatus Blautia gallistercoris]